MVKRFYHRLDILHKNTDRKYLSNKIGSLTCCNLQMMIIKGLDETHIINTQR